MVARGRPPLVISELNIKQGSTIKLKLSRKS
jgi:hypothetical protein